jgi:tetratricopeptide (TPR) repeat protein
VAIGLNNLAFVLRDRGDLPGAAALFREALDIFRAALGPDHVNYANVQGNLAEILAEQGDPSAEALAREALQKKLKVLPRDHQAVAVSLSLVGHLQAERGDAAGAELLREALATLLKTFPDTHERVVQVQARLTAALARSSR